MPERFPRRVFVAGSILLPALLPAIALAQSSESGVVDIYYSGIGNDKGELSDDINPQNENFVPLRLALRRKGHLLKNSHLFKWGSTGETYSSIDSMVDPQKKIDAAKEDFAKLDFDQANLIGFSWGGVVAEEVAEEFPDKVRSLTCYSSPLRGLWYQGRDWWEFQLGKAAATIATQKPYFKEEVSEYLFKRRRNQARIQRLDGFGRTFTQRGGILQTAFALDDPIVFPEVTKIQGAQEYSVSYGPVVDRLSYFWAHSRTVDDPQLAEILADAL